MLLCALLLAAAMPVCAAEDVTEYRIDEIGLTVEIPSDYDVYLYDNLPNWPNQIRMQRVFYLRWSIRVFL